MRTFESIVKQIEERKYAFFKLYTRQGFTDSMIDANFDVKDCTPEQAVAMLNGLIQSYENEPGTQFVIELAKNLSSNHSSRTDKIPFVVNIDAYNQARAAQGAGAGGNASLTPVLNGLQGLQKTQSDIFNERIAFEREIAAERQKLSEERLMLNFEKRDFEKEKAKFKEDEAETRKDLKELELKYNSRVAEVKEGAETALGNIIGSYLRNVNPLANAGRGAGPALAGVPQSEAQLQTIEEKTIESIANNIDEHVPNIIDIRAIGLMVQAFIDSPNDERFYEFREKAKNLKVRVA